MLPTTEPGKPASNRCCIRRPFVSELLAEPRLFVKYNAQVKCDGQRDCVPREQTRANGKAPAKEYCQDREVHRIAHEAIKSDDHQALGWVPRRKRASPGDQKVSAAPKEKKKTQPEQEIPKP